MENLYSTESYAAIDAQVRRRLIWLFAGVLVLLAVFVFAMVRRIQWLAMVSFSLAGCFAVFFGDLFCGPLVRYRRLVRGALSGRNHEQVLTFDRTEPDISVVEGVSRNSLIFLGEADKHGDREQLLYWDRELPMPALTPGQDYRVKYTGKNIIGMEAAPEAESCRP